MFIRARFVDGVRLEYIIGADTFTLTTISGGRRNMTFSHSYNYEDKTMGVYEDNVGEYIKLQRVFERWIENQMPVDTQSYNDIVYREMGKIR